MRVILMRDLRHTGRRGEVVEVKPGFARNHLLPKGLARELRPPRGAEREQRKNLRGLPFAIALYRHCRSNEELQTEARDTNGRLD